MIKKYLLLIATILTSTRLYSQDEKQITKKTSTPMIDNNINKETFIISLHHLSLVNIGQIIGTFSFYIDKKKICFLDICNCILKFNIEFKIYNNFYFKTKFFNNIFAAYAGINKTENNPTENYLYTKETKDINDAIKTCEFFSFAIGKKTSYGQSNNMFDIEIGCSIGKESNKSFSDAEKKLGIIISFIPYRRTFKNGIHIAVGHIVINITTLYDIINTKERGDIVSNFFFFFILNTLTLNIGYSMENNNTL